MLVGWMRLQMFRVNSYLEICDEALIHGAAPAFQQDNTVLHRTAGENQIA